MIGNQDGFVPIPENEDARLAALARYGVVGSGPEEEYDGIVAVAADVFNTPIAVLSLLGRDGLWLKARVGVDACEAPRDVSFCAHAILQDEPLVVPDATKDPRFAHSPLVTGPHHMRFYAGAPLVTPAGFRIGSLCVIDVEPRPPLTPKQEGTLRRLAAMAMDRLEQRRLWQIKRAATSLLSATSGAIVCADGDGRIVVWNKSAETLFGYSREEAVGRPYNSVLPARYHGREGSFEHLRDAKSRSLNGQTVEAHGVHRSGREFPVEMALAQSGDGDELLIGAIFRDITKRKDREASMRLLFKASPVPMWLYDIETLRFLAVNDAAVAHYGYTKEEFLARTVLDIRPESDREAALARIRSVSEDFQKDRSWRHVRADGTPIEVVTFARPTPFEGRRARLVAVMDVTDRMRALDELRSTRKFLDTVIESLPATLFVKNAADGRYLLVNRAGEDLFGIERQDVIGKTSFELFPGDAEHFVARDRETLQLGAASVGEERLSTPDRGNRLIRTTKIAVPDDDGKPQYILGICEDLTERKQTQERLNQLQWFDQLTGLPNRASLDGELTRIVNEGNGAVLLIGLDRFRHVNESLGHPVGDELLKAVAARVARALGSAGRLFRPSGDQLALIVAAADRQDTAALCERILSVFEAPFWAAGHALYSRASVGIAIGPEHGGSSADLMAAAELALHKAKADGGRCHRVFEDSFRNRVRTRHHMEDELRRAVVEGEFELFYQPQIRLSDRAVVGAEALIRWRHPERGLLAPGAFLPVLETSEFAAAVGHWTIATAAAFLGRLRASGLPAMQVGVNLFGAQLRSPELADVVKTAIARNKLPYHAIELELTENILLKQDEEEVVAPLRGLLDLGVGIAFDDYGTGFASLSLLKRFPLTRLKIDRGFVHELASDGDDAAIVKAVLGLGQSLGLAVIAEGIETPEQERLLKDLGCTEGQGYLYGKPMPGAEFEAAFAAACARAA